MAVVARMPVALALTAGLVLAPAAPAQEAWPQRQVNVVVPFAPGGSGH